MGGTHIDNTKEPSDSTSFFINFVFLLVGRGEGKKKIIVMEHHMHMIGVSSPRTDENVQHASSISLSLSSPFSSQRIIISNMHRGYTCHYYVG